MPVGTFADRLLFRRTRGRRSDGRRTLGWAAFAAPFVMMRYLCVLLPALYYMTAFAYGSLLFGATGAVVFGGRLRLHRGADRPGPLAPARRRRPAGGGRRGLAHRPARLPGRGAPARTAPRRALALAARPRRGRRPGGVHLARGAHGLGGERGRDGGRVVWVAGGWDGHVHLLHGCKSPSPSPSQPTINPSTLSLFRSRFRPPSPDRSARPSSKSRRRARGAGPSGKRSRS